MRLLFAAVCVAFFVGAAQAETGGFTGSEACGECHVAEYESFMAKSKKAKSWKSVEIMASDLKPHEVETCYECHTTGYGQPGGFVSFQATPHLADVGCETCHGPGALHSETEDPDDLLAVTVDTCETCHNGERTGVFDFRALLFAGAH